MLWKLAIDIVYAAFNFREYFVILIEHSKLLSYLGLAIAFGFTSLSAIKLKRELNHRNNTKNSFNQPNNQQNVEEQ